MRGQEKPYKECKECLFILCKCLLCEDADSFFDRVNVIADEINITVIENGVLTPIISTRYNRNTTQRRDGYNV